MKRLPKVDLDAFHADLDTLQLAFVREHYDEFLTTAAKQQWDHLPLLARLLEGEADRRRDRAIARRIRLARFPVNKTLDAFDWTWPKKINRPQVMNLFRLHFVEQASNVVFIAGVGLGKSHLAIALARRACEQRYSVLFASAVDVINTLAAAQAIGRLKHGLNLYIKPRVLVLDELGYLPIDKTGADLLFQIVSQRYERASTVITTNRVYRKWPEIFNHDATLTSAVLDRLLHHAETIVIEGNSFRMRAAATGSIIARMARPGSERAARRWLSERSALGELLGVDFETMGPMQLYRASDALMAHREAIERHLFDRTMGLFDLHPTVTLYDLTNTFFEGEAARQPKAKRGHSKDKRTDCPLLTLGLVLDASGFVRRSQVFAGNVREYRTLAQMLEALHAPREALVVMDRAIATEECVSWLRENAYRYLVVSRERTRHFDPEVARRIETASRQGVHLHKVVSEDGQEVRLYCFSEERANKERAMVERFAGRFEQALTQMGEGLSRPRTEKRADKIRERIGRLKAKSRGIAQHYHIDIDTDDTGERATAVRFTRHPVEGSMMTHPGVYCLRSTQTDWDEETLWRTASSSRRRMGGAASAGVVRKGAPRRSRRRARAGRGGSSGGRRGTVAHRARRCRWSSRSWSRRRDVVRTARGPMRRTVHR